MAGVGRTSSLLRSTLGLARRVDCRAGCWAMAGACHERSGLHSQYEEIGTLAYEQDCSALRGPVRAGPSNPGNDRNREDIGP